MQGLPQQRLTWWGAGSLVRLCLSGLYTVAVTLH